MCFYRTGEGICKKFSVYGVTSYCVDGPCPDEVLTNADRIRAMSDEELAEWLNYYAHDGYINPPCGWFEWLKQPEEEDET